jgi:TRAP-type mannitol/chloroaromatic compound transport system permease small subunit
MKRKREYRMENLLRLADRISHWGGLFGGALLLLASVLVSIDVTLRKCCLMTLGGADELAGYALAISSAWGLAYALLNRVHIRIDSLYVLLPVRLCALLDVISVLSFAFFFGIVAYHAYFVFEQSLISGSSSVSPLGTPLVIPQALWVAGLVEFVLVASLLLVRGVQLFIAGEIAAVQRMLGSRSAVEEVEDELKGLRELGHDPAAEAAR